MSPTSGAASSAFRMTTSSTARRRSPLRTPNCAGTTVNHTVNAPSLADQLTSVGKTWKSYFQNLPYVDPSQAVSSGPGANGPYAYKWPSNTDALYASKHNPFINFTGTQGALSQMVPDNQLGLDLQTGQLPNYSLVVPDQCHDMHGTNGCSDPTGLIKAGDQYVGTSVRQVMASPTWEKGNNAIVITWDEDDYSDQGSSEPGAAAPTPVAAMWPPSSSPTTGRPTSPTTRPTTTTRCCGPSKRRLVCPVWLMPVTAWSRPCLRCSPSATTSGSARLAGSV